MHHFCQLLLRHTAFGAQFSDEISRFNVVHLVSFLAEFSLCFHLEFPAVTDEKKALSAFAAGKLLIERF